jgi:hypothetical protein
MQSAVAVILEGEAARGGALRTRGWRAARFALRAYQPSARRVYQPAALFRDESPPASPRRAGCILAVRTPLAAAPLLPHPTSSLEYLDAYPEQA